MNQARYLSEKAGYAHRVEQRNLDFRILGWTWRFGNVVLSKYPVTKCTAGRTPWLLRLAGHKQAVDCIVNIGSRRIRISWNTPLTSQRIRSAERMTEIVGLSDLPTIIAGDL